MRVKVVYGKDRSDDCSVEGNRRRGRPKTTWRRTVEKERQEAGWKSWEEVPGPQQPIERSGEAL